MVKTVVPVLLFVLCARAEVLRIELVKGYALVRYHEPKTNVVSLDKVHPLTTTNTNLSIEFLRDDTTLKYTLGSAGKGYYIISSAKRTLSFTAMLSKSRWVKTGSKTKVMLIVIAALTLLYFLIMAWLSRSLNWGKSKSKLAPMSMGNDLKEKFIKKQSGLDEDGKNGN